MRRSAALIAPILLPLVNLLCTGCGGSNKSAAKSSGPLQSSSSSFPTTVTDVLGRQTEIVNKPKRIVSLTPTNTETLFAIGAGQQVVGVTTLCNYPEEARRREKVGAFLAESISLEKIVGLQPDVVFLGGAYHRKIISGLERLGISVIAVDPQTIDGVFETITSMGHVTGHVEQAEQLVASMRERAASVRRAAAEIADSQKLRVFYQVNVQPLMAAGRKSFIGEMIELCGGKNIFAELDSPYPQVSEEVVIDRNPQVILAPSLTQSGGVRIKTDQGWQVLDAVKQNRIHYLDADLVSRPGPRLIDGVEAVARAIYPDNFGKSPAP